MLTDRVSQACLRGKGHRVNEVFDLEYRFLSIPHHPECDGIYIDGNRISGQGGLRLEVCDPDPLVYVVGDLVDDRQHEEKAGASEPSKTTEAQHDRLLPLVRHLETRGDESGHDHCGHEDRDYQGGVGGRPPIPPLWP